MRGNLFMVVDDTTVRDREPDVEKKIAQLAPLTDQLQRFVRAHERGEGGAAAGEMLAALRDTRPLLSGGYLMADPDDGRDGEELALGIIRDVGEIADRLTRSDDLAWARANLICDLERYLAVTWPSGN
jgi:hypothetical protein